MDYCLLGKRESGEGSAVLAGLQPFAIAKRGRTRSLKLLPEGWQYYVRVRSVCAGIRIFIPVEEADRRGRAGIED